MIDDNDLYLDSFDEDQEDEESFEQPGADDAEGDSEEQPTKKGNLSIALQTERKQRQDLERRLKRTEALLQQVQPPQQHQQVHPELRRQQMQEMLLERPDEFMAAFQNNTLQALQQHQERQSSLTRDKAQYIKSNPEYQQACKDPDIAEALDLYLDSQMKQGAIRDANDLQEHIDDVMSFVGKVRGGGKQPGKDPALSRMSSSVGKGGGSNRSSLEETINSKVNSGQYHKWKDTPEGKKTIAAYTKHKPGGLWR